MLSGFAVNAHLPDFGVNHLRLAVRRRLRRDSHPAMFATSAYHEVEVAMSSGDARARSEALLAAWNRRDYDEIGACVSTDVVLVDHIRGSMVQGTERYMDRFRPMMDAFPDMVGECTAVLVNGDLVAQETRWHGTHTNPLALPNGRVIEPTHQQVSVNIAIFLEFDDEGKAKMIRIYGNPTEVMPELEITSSLAAGTG